MSDDRQLATSRSYTIDRELSTPAPRPTTSTTIIIVSRSSQTGRPATDASPTDRVGQALSDTRPDLADAHPSIHPSVRPSSGPSWSSSYIVLTGHATIEIQYRPQERLLLKAAPWHSPRLCTASRGKKVDICYCYTKRCSFSYGLFSTTPWSSVRHTAGYSGHD